MAIHAACRYCPSNEEVIRMLIDANPSALRSRTRMGNLVQKKNGVSPSLRPIEVAQHNQHIALDGTTSPAWRESQIKSIAERRFEERSQQVRDGSYPLHMAISSGAPKQVLEMLVKEAPEVASKTNKFGQTCLHLAVKNGGTANDEVGCSIDVAKFLVHAYPESAQMKNKDGNRPLDVAVAFGRCSKELINYLLALSDTDDVEVSQ